jgi:hypothetical protein
MKKLLYIFLGLSLMFACSDGPEIIPCIIIDVNNDIVCPEIYEPVCGCNDVTYDNECYAEVSGQYNWTEGECLD